MRAHAQALVEEARTAGCLDATTEFAQIIPTITMCILMDLPTDDREQFLKWNLATLAGADFTSEAALDAYSEMSDYWERLVANRRQNPEDDLISQVLHTEVKGDDLTDEEIAGFCSLLHDASQNTTMNMISHGVMTLGRFPDECHKLIEQPNRWPDALEEIMRYVSPVQGLARVTTKDVTLHGRTIPAGDQVLLLYGSANHDGDVYENPERFDPDRKVTTQWVFGHGIHYCLGNAVARLEVLTGS